MARILIAPGPYKECLSAYQVARAMERGVREILGDAVVHVRPLCDGGTGIARVLVEATGGHLVETTVCGPMGAHVVAQYGMLGDGETAVIESASAAGLSLVPRAERNPLRTTTFGVGELIGQAVRQGAKRIVVGCGDSGTNDCGIGCAAALGVCFNMVGGEQAGRPSGGDLSRIQGVDLSQVEGLLQNVEIIVACNLTSILCGPEGTSRIYGPQKGATPEQVEALHLGVQHFTDIVFEATGVDLSFVPGAGGAGGLAASLYAFFGARLLYSIDVVDKYLRLDEVLSTSDLVLTGEGTIDDRTATGKVACGIALKAKRYALPVVAIVGSIAEDHEDIFYNGIDAVESIAEGPCDIDYLMANAECLIERATVRVMRFSYRLLNGC